MITAHSFFQALFGDAVGPAARLAIFTLPDRRTAFFGDLAQAAAYLDRVVPTADVYFGVGLYRPGIASGRGGAADVVCLTAGFADVDFGPGHKKRVPPDEQTALRIVDSIGFAPSIVVRSGGGLHVYWRLKEPLTPADGAALFARRMVGTVQARAQAFGYELDSVGDLARVLRVPGTFNRKTVPARPVTIHTFAPDRRYDPDDLEHLLVDVEETSPAAHVPDVPLGAALPRAKLLALILNDPSFAAVWNGTRRFTSPSERDLSIASRLVRALWRDEEIAAALAAGREQLGANPDKASRPDYVARTIAVARASAAKSRTSRRAIYV